MYHLSGLTKCYPDGREGAVVRVLDEVELYVEEGGALVVQGPAGAGKSTLLRILGGLERPTRGRVELDGTDLATATESRLARIRAESIGWVSGDALPRAGPPRPPGGRGRPRAPGPRPPPRPGQGGGNIKQ
ncbi:ATP-binding cassette domain-containing protein, partial [Streptomyces decoyicus]|uniref:ATP-binding cassette domain-containing protein n=1 Tax=Streptomyces decoyicus TaxID=249567 RepID=UPI003630AB64